MRYIDATSIGAVSSMITRTAGAALPVAGIGAMLFSRGRGRGLSRAKIKKMSRRRFRMFIDNIVMHHRRLHERNRQITIDLTRAKILNRNKKKEIERKNLQRNKSKWQDKCKLERSSSIKGRVDTRRIRARSRWTSIVEESKKNTFITE